MRTCWEATRDDSLLATTQCEPTATLATLNKEPASVARGIVWDQKQHNGEIVVDPDYVGKECFHAATDVELVRKLCDHMKSQSRLVRCHDAVWYMHNDETHVAIPDDRNTTETIYQRLLNELQHYELRVVPCLPK